MIQYCFNSITVFQFFPLWDSWGPGTLPPMSEYPLINNDKCDKRSFG